MVKGIVESRKEEASGFYSIDHPFLRVILFFHLHMSNGVCSIKSRYDQVHKS